MRNAYHRISMILAKQAPAEYMSADKTHITDYDPETGEYGDARHVRQRGDGPPKEMVNSWVALHNSGVSTLEIVKRFKYPFRTVENEIAKHPKGKASVLTTIHLTNEIAKEIDDARGEEPISKFILKLLETAVNNPGYAKAATTQSEGDRWRRMRERGLGNSQIAEAVGTGVRRVYDELGPESEKRVVKKPGGGQRRVSVRMPLWLKNMLEAAAQAVGTTRAKLQRALIGKELGLAVA